MSSNLSGYVCLVTGANEEIGQGIAIGLGKAGACVYITDKNNNVRTDEQAKTVISLENTAQMIEAAGGKAIPVAVDHSDDSQVTGLFSRIRREKSGQLDILVNCAFGAQDYLFNQFQNDMGYWDSPTAPAQEWDIVNRIGLRNTYTCCVLATKMMIKYRKQMETNQMNNSSNHSIESSSPSSNSAKSNIPTGLIINISDIGGTLRSFNVAFCAGKSALDRLSQEMSRDLNKFNIPISVLSLVPGLIQTDSVVSAYEKGHYMKILSRDVSLSMAIPTITLGDIVAELAMQPKKKLLNYSGRCLIASELAREFRVKSTNGHYCPNLFSVKSLLNLMGWKRLAFWVPDFIKIPKWFITLITSKF